MIREIITIDEDKCDGCGLCVPACHEGAIQMIDGKAKLIADNLCDGIGDCLGHCPQDAIIIEKRQADNFDEAAVEVHLKKNTPETPAAPAAQNSMPPQGGCPGSRMLNIEPKDNAGTDDSGQRPSELQQWPIQLHLVPPTAPFFQDADVLFAATCAPFAYPEFHRDIMKDKALIIACPKLDKTEPYVEKITAMITQGNIKSLTVAHMEVPCCGGLLMMVRQAVADSGKDIPVETICLGLKGDVIDR